MLQCVDTKLRFHEQSRAEIWFFTQNLGCCLIGHLYIMQNRVSLPRCSGGWVQHYPGHTVGVCFFDNLIQLISRSLWGESKPLAVPIIPPWAIKMWTLTVICLLKVDIQRSDAPLALCSKTRISWNCKQLMDFRGSHRLTVKVSCILKKNIPAVQYIPRFR